MIEPYKVIFWMYPNLMVDLHFSFLFVPKIGDVIVVSPDEKYYIRGQYRKGTGEYIPEYLVDYIK